jgi:hypothetical protein
MPVIGRLAMDYEIEYINKSLGVTFFWLLDEKGLTLC